MKQNQVQTLKGFRDFLPKEAKLRQEVKANIVQSFERFAFVPLETPTLEYASLLLGKYGEEADKLLYTFEDRGGRSVGLRYDQTVPTARLLANYQNELPKYLRRYQIQNVFRADKPQKGRYREFTQCDVDIFGSTSPLADAEILAVYYDVFKNLGLGNIQIEYNDRQLLVDSLAEFATKQVSVLSIIQSIDKLDKVSPEVIVAELVEKGLDQTQAEAVLSKLDQIEKSSNLIEIEQKAIALGVPASALIFNPKIARGLDYYTGLIFEGKVPGSNMGSLGGGGRYDRLIEELSGLKMPAVGVGLGFDRIVELVAAQAPAPSQSAQVLITNFGDENCQNKAYELASTLRQANIATELFLEPSKMAKQFKLAESKNIPWVIVLGESEVADNKISLKNLQTGEQTSLSEKELFSRLKQTS